MINPIRLAIAPALLISFAALAQSPAADQPLPSPSAAASPAPAPTSLKAAARLSTMEVRAAKLLQRMIYDKIEIDGRPRAAIDRIIAQFVRDSVDNRPEKAILLAFNAQNVVASDGTVFEPLGDRAEDFDKGKVDPTRPYLVDLVLAELDPMHYGRVNTVVARWNKLRQQKILDGPIMRLQRAINDPELIISPELRTQLQVKTDEMLKAIPKEDRRPPHAGKYEPEIRAAVLAMIDDEDAARKLNATLAMMDVEAAEWDQPDHLTKVYEESLALLNAPAEKSAAPSAAAPVNPPANASDGGK